MGVQYIILWLEIEIHTTPTDDGCGMDFFHQEIVLRLRARSTMMLGMAQRHIPDHDDGPSRVGFGHIVLGYQVKNLGPRLTRHTVGLGRVW